jgi:hypothetical protein|uniref:Uncharacterized protein n=2 Tax=Panagrolaimus sp. PS1159 TaxID=55785 RepID=A0AC35G5F2_9BILA
MSEQDLIKIRMDIANKLENVYKCYKNVSQIDKYTEDMLTEISREIKDGKDITECSDADDAVKRKIRKDVYLSLEKYIHDEEAYFKVYRTVALKILQKSERSRKERRFQNFLNFFWNLIVKLSGAVVLLALIFALFDRMSNNESSLASEHLNYDQMLQDTFPFHFETLIYLGSQLQLPDDRRKVITLIVASNEFEKTDKFLQTFVPLTKQFFLSYTHSEYAASEQVHRQELFTAALKESQKNDGKVILVVKNIDLLKSEAPLALQSIAEIDDPRFQNTFAIFTVTLDEQFHFDQNCKELIRRHLEDRWSENNLPDGKLAAIMSRISEDCICLY